jgi:phage FluMu gp28-like protein
MVVSKTDREAIAAGEIVKRAIEELPSWMQPQMSKNNDHQKIFSDTGCKLFFYPPEAARGRSITYLVIDEAAFIQNMDAFWNGIFPTISTGGNVIVISTVNGVAGHGGWYYRNWITSNTRTITTQIGSHPCVHN